MRVTKSQGPGLQQIGRKTNSKSTASTIQVIFSHQQILGAMKFDEEIMINPVAEAQKHNQQQPLQSLLCAH